MDRFLKRLLSFYFRIGNVRITIAGGQTFTCGDGTGTPLAVCFRSHAAAWSCVLDPELKFGEAYMDGDVVIEQGSIADVLALAMRQNNLVIPTWVRPLWALRM